MNNTAEQSAPQESEVLNQGARSENYMARFLTQTSDAFDSTKPFILGSPDPLKITPDKLQILDRYTLDYASNYWSGGEKKAMTHDQKLQEFGSKWANAITKRYALPKEGEAIYVAELNRRKDSGEVLKKLGLDPENMSVDAVRKFHDENFANGGRDVNAFISKVKQSLTAEEMRAHLDDIEFVARMFDRETAKDIRALIELDLDANKDNYAKRANSQGTIRSDEEKRRLQQLAKYLKRETNDGVIKINSEPAVQVKVDAEKKDTTDGEVDVRSPKDSKEPTTAARTTAADIETTGTEDKPTVEITDADLKPEPVLEVDVPGVLPAKDDLSGQIEITGAGSGKIDAGENAKASDIDWMNVSEAKIPEREFPVDAKLYGQEGDNLRIVISEPVLVQINKVLKEMSWKEGDFKEKGAVFIGKKYKDKDGKLWTDIVGALPLLKTVSKWGAITFTPDSWVEAYDMIDHFLNVEKDGKRRPEEDQLELISWVHTHPEGWEGVLSAQDEKPAMTFVNPWNFAYVYAAGLGEDTPVDVSQVNAGDVGKLFAYFSTGGAGTNYGTYNKHNGFYTRPKTDRDKAYGTGDALPNGKAVDDLIKELEVILV